MGRRKVQLKLIEDRNSRQVTFSKRRSGLMKKARELSILCDVEVAVFVFSGKGRLYEFCSGDSLRKIMEHYQFHMDAQEEAGQGVHETKKHHTAHGGLWTCNDLLQMVQRDLETQMAVCLNIRELSQLEHQLDAILQQTRIRKTDLMMEAVTSLHKQDEYQREVNQLVEKEIATLTNEADCHYQADPVADPNDHASGSNGSVPLLQQAMQRLR
ncbi:hypothetical protein F0562_004494 [Nyssa sinensis]|uniref:MADS-box domain-containing protein n=1 Tax=Nyssa sinensis TaxID=561372 RepID=A0A5J5BYR2_9ASTE|nr:hypothetical protein F0562_004494 [Nyssa sinensis]